MKTAKKSLSQLFIVALLILPLFSKAQQQEIPRASTLSLHEAKSVSWSAVKLSGESGNSSNGVEFYSRQSKCNLEKVEFLKFVNKNKYAVSVSYRMAVGGPVINVTVPASSDLEGVCSAPDDNVAKLVVSSPVPYGTTKTNNEKEKKEELMLSDIVVTQIQ
jgi:hypothetical protein